MQKTKDGVYEIDLRKLFHLLWSKIWLILLSAALLGAAAFAYAKMMIAPTYEASTWIYVNNSSISVSSATYSISTGQISGARSLVDTYTVILSSRSMLNKVISKANLDYTYKQLKGMISCGAINETEIFSVTVTAFSPEEAELIANTIADILPDMISDIVDNSSVRVVDRAVKPTVRSSPSYTKYAAIGVLLGALLACGIVFLKDFFDDIIRSDEYLTETYGVPILARIPKITDEESEGGYYTYGKEKGA